MVLEAIFGVVSKNIMAFLSKKNSGTWDYKKGFEDLGYGVAAVITVWGARTLFNVELALDAVTGTMVYLSLTWGWDRIIGMINKKLIHKDKEFHLLS